MYYIGSMQCDPNYLKHHGVPGQQKGVRRYQNEDGSLTPLGREHYGVGERMSTDGADIYQKQQIRRMNRQQRKLARYNNGRIKAGERDGYDVFTEEDARRNNATMDRRAAKAQAKYDQAKSRLEAYNNASDVEKRKARNSIRLKRAAIIGAATAAVAGIGLAAISRSQSIKFGEKAINKYMKDDVLTDMKVNYLWGDKLKEGNILDVKAMGKGRMSSGSVGHYVRTGGDFEQARQSFGKAALMRNRGYGTRGRLMSDSDWGIRNRIGKIGDYAKVGALGAGVVGIGAAAHKTRHPGEKRETYIDPRARKWKRK